MTLTPERRAELREEIASKIRIENGWTVYIKDTELAALLDAADERDRLHECLDQRERCQLLVEKERDWLAAENANLRSLLEEIRDSDMVASRHIDGQGWREEINSAIAPAPASIALPPGDSLPHLDEAETKEKP